jgi:hypothetical protein
MPYAKRKNGENWDVYNTETNEVKATHEPPEAEEKADRQVKLLNGIEADPQWDEDED